MAFLTETRSTAISVADHANDAIANFKAYLARRRVERQLRHGSDVMTRRVGVGAASL